MNVAIAPFAILMLLLVVLIVYLRSDPGRAFGHTERHVSMSSLIGLIMALGLGLALRQTNPADVADLRPRLDAIEYDLTSRALAHGDGFVMPYQDRVYPPRCSIGFPLLVAGTRLVTGEVDTPGVAAWVSWFLGGVVIALAFFLAHELAGHKAGVAAAFLTALSPFQVYHARQPMADMAALAFLLATLYLCVRTLRKGRVRPAMLFLLAFLAGFGTTIRVASALMIPIVAYVALALVPRTAGRRGLAWSALVGGLLIGLSPQLVVNWTQHGSPLRTGYTFWQPGVYGDRGLDVFEYDPVHGRPISRQEDNFRAYARMLMPISSFADDGARFERAAEPKPKLTREEKRARRKEKIHPYELVERRFDVEPHHLYPFFVFVLAIVGFGLSSQEGEKRTVRRATAMTLIAGTLFFALYAVYPFRETRFLLPLQVLVLVFAARAFTARSRPLRIAVWVLALYALWSALPELSRATRAPQGNPPFGRTDEERTTLAALDDLLPDENVTLIAHTHGSLIEEELLDHDRRWVPLALDGHERRIEAYGLRDHGSPRKASAERLERLASYQLPALEWTATTDVLVTRLAEGTLTGATFDETDREWLLTHLDKLSAIPYPRTTVLLERVRNVFYEDLSEAARDELLATCRDVSLGAIARRIGELVGEARTSGRSLYYVDLCIFDLGALGQEIDRMLREEAYRREMHRATFTEEYLRGGNGEELDIATIDARTAFVRGEFKGPDDAASPAAEARWRVARPGFKKDDAEGYFHLFELTTR